jgi:hypothetical protein
MKQKHPMQPISLDRYKVARFKVNEIVRFLLDAGPFDMNQLACMKFSKDDRWQFAQLIGYSVSGIGDLHYADPEQLAEADRIVEKL